MKTWSLVLIVLGVLLLAACTQGAEPTAAPRATAPSPTAVVSPTVPTATPTATPTEEPTATATAVPTATPVYQASAKILVTLSLRTITPSPTAAGLSQDLIDWFVEIAGVAPTLDAVRENLDWDISTSDLRSRVSLSSHQNSRILTLTAKDANPVSAAQIANVMAENFIQRVQEVRLAEFARLRAAATAQGLTDNEIERLIKDHSLSTIFSLSIVEPAIPPLTPLAPEKELR